MVASGYLFLLIRLEILISVSRLNFILEVHLSLIQQYLHVLRIPYGMSKLST